MVLLYTYLLMICFQTDHNDCNSFIGVQCRPGVCFLEPGAYHTHDAT